MEQKLQYQEVMNKLDAAGKITLEERHYLEKDGSLRADKVKLLHEIIFPAMANLTFFFESVARHPELQEVFDRDIKDLFGVHRNIPPEKIHVDRPKYASMFERLIDSMVTYDSKARPRELRDRKNFRIRLLSILQRIVSIEVQHNMPDDFSLEAERTILMDMGRAEGWTATLGMRVPDFSPDEIKAGKNQPHRTFDFEPI
jgi:hypothetical protein